MLDRRAFLSLVRDSWLFHGDLSPSQEDGLSALLDAWQAATSDPRWIAYALATAYHETDRTMRPIAEYGHGLGHPYGHPDPKTGMVYYGRGYVQLTWDYNYKGMAPFVGVDLYLAPERAMEPPVAAKIMVVGMTNGTFTGKKLGDYFNDRIEDWVGARRIVNGIDRANIIASYGKAFRRGLDAAGTAASPAPLSFDVSTVAGVQGALRALGYVVAVDGVTGPETKAIIKAFQAQDGRLTVDGIAGPATQAAIVKGLASLSV